EAATYRLRDLVIDDPSLIGKRRNVWLPSSSEVDQVHKGKVPRSQAEGGPLDERQVGWLAALEKSGDLRLRWNSTFFTSGDSRDPQQAGILAALLGSFYAILVTLVISFPLGVAAAVYLEELAPKNRRWLDAIEVNINNLAAVPSIVFGLLGLAVFLNVFGLPRSSPLVGGMILSLMTLPVIIIAGRAALQAVPPSIRHAAYALGATPLQVIQHHVLPMAMPGILTGTIIGLARAVGESAPLLMVGMVAFVVDPPKTPLDPASALPVQVYLWADSPERGFVEKTSAAILVLLAFLIAMNSVAVILRRRWERRL
ncbi:MAG TPA: phosphate ABC transporter permease PstA, partial [Thermoanaerobaculia bacterium]|nr:phosphate ABC transporter permease PstA [Thermoanaerobaculia bacterium]